MDKAASQDKIILGYNLESGSHPKLLRLDCILLSGHCRLRIKLKSLNLRNSKSLGHCINL